MPRALCVYAQSKKKEKKQNIYVKKRFLLHNFDSDRQNKAVEKF